MGGTYMLDVDMEKPGVQVDHMSTQTEGIPVTGEHRALHKVCMRRRASIPIKVPIAFDSFEALKLSSALFLELNE